MSCPLNAPSLTDPVWAEYASPVPFGPKRFRPPGLPIGKLPKIDFVRFFVVGVVWCV